MGIPFSTNGLLTMEECSFVYSSLILDTVLIGSSFKVLENFLAGKICLNKSLNDLLIIFNVYISTIYLSIKQVTYFFGLI